MSSPIEEDEIYKSYESSDTTYNIISKKIYHIMLNLKLYTDHEFLGDLIKCYLRKMNHIDLNPVKYSALFDLDEVICSYYHEKHVEYKYNIKKINIYINIYNSIKDIYYIELIKNIELNNNLIDFFILIKCKLENFKKNFITESGVVIDLIKKERKYILESLDESDLNFDLFIGIRDYKSFVKCLMKKDTLYGITPEKGIIYRQFIYFFDNIKEKINKLIFSLIEKKEKLISDKYIYENIINYMSILNTFHIDD